MGILKNDSVCNQPEILIPDILLAGYATGLLDGACIEPQIIDI
jgi:hypothetical protein